MVDMASTLATGAQQTDMIDLLTTQQANREDVVHIPSSKEYRMQLFREEMNKRGFFGKIGFAAHWVWDRYCTIYG